MPQNVKALASAMLLMGCALIVRAQSLVIPDVAEATDAIVEMFSGVNIPKPSKVRLGTCIPAMDAVHAGQIACTVSVTLGAGTTETQADFFQQGKQWKAQPSVSQDKLPFPDPKLR